MSDPEKDEEGDDDVQEQEAIEHTEETGEVEPSGLWPEGDEDLRSPI